MGSLLVVRTRTDRPELFLAQNREPDELLRNLRTDIQFVNARGWIYELKPGPEQLKNGTGLVTLNQLGRTDMRSAAEAHLQEAIYFARIDGHSDEVEVLGKFAHIVLANLKEAKARAERLTGPGVISPPTVPARPSFEQVSSAPVESAEADQPKGDEFDAGST